MHCIFQATLILVSRVGCACAALRASQSFDFRLQCCRGSLAAQALVHAGPCTAAPETDQQPICNTQFANSRSRSAGNTLSPMITVYRGRFSIALALRIQPLGWTQKHDRISLSVALWGQAKRCQSSTDLV